MAASKVELTSPARPRSESPQPISIWQPRGAGDDLVFERPKSLPLGDHYATRRRIPARKVKRRICFFGESAAAGYLYAPHLTPAGILEQQLGAFAPENAFEVVDLARTNERIRTLVQTVEASLQLDPDLLVIFAGNNWNLLETPEMSAYFPSVEARVRFAGLLRAGGLSGAVDHAARDHLREGAAALETISALARSRSIPVVVVVPEVNLADWETLQPCTWLSGEKTVCWHEQFEASLRELVAGRFEEAAAAARAMLDLDGGLCPTSYRLLARAWQGQGRLEQAAQACRGEVAAASYASICFLGAPQATPAVQELLRRTAKRLGLATVDLPRVFARHTGSPLPGRRLFLDYCHLTIEGMKVAMAATSAEVLRITSGRQFETLDALGLLEDLPDPEITAQADATAKLGAAIHCAHRLLPVVTKQPLLEHWCDEALDADPGIADAMLDLIAARSAPLPAVLTRAQIRNFDSPYRLGFQHGWRYDFLDADLLAAMGTALERHGHEAGSDLDRRLIKPGDDFPSRSRDLVSENQLLEPLARVFSEVIGDQAPRGAFHRSPWPESRFWFSSDAGREILLEVRARLPGGEAAALGRKPPTAAVEVNGSRVASLDLGSRWRAETLRVDSELLRPGLNEITLRWPMPAQPGEQGLETALGNLELGRGADLHPIFGELFSLRITA